MNQNKEKSNTQETNSKHCLKHTKKECTKCSINWRPNCNEIKQLRENGIKRHGFNREPIWKGVSPCVDRQNKDKKSDSQKSK